LPPGQLLPSAASWQRTLAAFIDSGYVRPEHQALITLRRTGDEAVKKMMIIRPKTLAAAAPTRPTEESAGRGSPACYFSDRPEKYPMSGLLR